MKKRERGVSFYDIHLRCGFHGVAGTPLPMPTSTALELAYQKYTTVSDPADTLFLAGQRRVTLEDWKFDSGRGEHYLVLSCADPDLSDVSFKHMKTGGSRMAGKMPEEAIDKSCHVLLRPGAAAPDPALMLQTSQSGVSADRICFILSAMLRRAATIPANAPHFERNHPDGITGRKLKLTTTFEQRGHQSVLLEQIVRTGRIDAIELITELHEGIDDDKGYQITSKTIKVEAVDDQAVGTMARLKKIVTSIKGESPNKARIHFRETEHSAKQIHTFHTNELEKAFTRREVITFDTDVFPKYTLVSTDVIDKMRALL